MKYSLKEIHKQEKLKKFKEEKHFLSIDLADSINKRLNRLSYKEKQVMSLNEKFRYSQNSLFSNSSKLSTTNNVLNTTNHKSENITRISNFNTEGNNQTQQTPSSTGRFKLFEKFKQNNLNTDPDLAESEKKPTFLRLLLDTVSIAEEKEETDHNLKDKKTKEIKFLNTEETHTPSENNKKLNMNINTKNKPTIRKPYRFLIDEIIYQYKKYEKSKERIEKMKFEEFIDTNRDVPHFNIKNYFISEDQLEKKINSSSLPPLISKKPKSRSKNKQKSGKAENPEVLNLITSKSNKSLVFKNDNTDQQQFESINSNNIKGSYREVFKRKQNEFKLINNKAKKLIKHNKKQSLESFQSSLMKLLGNKISDEYLRSLANSFKEISTMNKLPMINLKLKTPKTNWEVMVDKISPYIPQYLADKLRSIK